VVVSLFLAELTLLKRNQSGSQMTGKVVLINDLMIAVSLDPETNKFRESTPSFTFIVTLVVLSALPASIELNRSRKICSGLSDALAFELIVIFFVKYKIEVSFVLEAEQFDGVLDS
jgi:hypothetical protein